MLRTFAIGSFIAGSLAAPVPTATTRRMPPPPHEVAHPPILSMEPGRDLVRPDDMNQPSGKSTRRMPQPPHEVAHPPILSMEPGRDLVRPDRPGEKGLVELPKPEIGLHEIDPALLEPPPDLAAQQAAVVAHLASHPDDGHRRSMQAAPRQEAQGAGPKSLGGVSWQDYMGQGVDTGVDFAQAGAGTADGSVDSTTAFSDLSQETADDLSALDHVGAPAQPAQ